MNLIDADFYRFRTCTEWDVILFSEFAKHFAIYEPLTPGYDEGHGDKIVFKNEIWKLAHRRILVKYL